MFKYDGTPASSAKRVESFADVDAEALAILESQMLNYRTRSHAILSSDDSSAHLARVYATGGAAKNPTICSVMADALGCPVSKSVEWRADKKKWTDASWNECSVGVAYKARWGWERHIAAQKGDKARASISFDDLMAEIRRKRHASLGSDALTAPGAPDEEGVHNVATPGAGSPAYANASEWWKVLEARALSEMK